MNLELEGRTARLVWPRIIRTAEVEQWPMTGTGTLQKFPRREAFAGAMGLEWTETAQEASAPAGGFAGPPEPDR